MLGWPGIFRSVQQHGLTLMFDGVLDQGLMCLQQEEQQHLMLCPYNPKLAEAVNSAVTGFLKLHDVLCTDLPRLAPHCAGYHGGVGPQRLRSR